MKLSELDDPELAFIWRDKLNQVGCTCDADLTYRPAWVYLHHDRSCAVFHPVEP